MTDEKAVLRVEQALGSLASAWRAANEDERPKIQNEYASLLNVLLSWGITYALDPDCELPDKNMPIEYLQLIGRI